VPITINFGQFVQILDKLFKIDQNFSLGYYFRFIFIIINILIFIFNFLLVLWILNNFDQIILMLFLNWMKLLDLMTGRYT